MFASVSTRTELTPDYFEVRCSRDTHDDARVDRINVHVSTGIYFALTPDEARVIRAELGRVLAELEPVVDVEDVTGVIL